MASVAFETWLDELPSRASFDPVWSPYRSYADTWRLIDRLLSEASRPATIEAIGQSVDGRPIWAVFVGPVAPGGTFVMAGIHAMEHVGVATAVALVERAVSDASPWNEPLVVVPMLNPDGFVDVEDGLAAGRRRFWRSNRHGVDLNRNFGTFWDGSYFWNRAVRFIFSPGDGPLSEPESQAIDRLLSRIAPRFAVSLHAFGEFIFTPYAGKRDHPPDHERLLEVAGFMAAAQPTRAYRCMQLARRTRLFQARGAEIDHFYERHGALSFLIEIGAGPRLAVPSTWTVPYRWFTPPARLLESDVANVVPAIEALAAY